MEIKEEKALLRRQIREKTAALPEEYRRQSAIDICKRVLALPEYQKAETVLLFIAMAEEVNTLPILLHALVAGKRVAAPKCTGKGQMEARLVSKLEDLEPGAWGIAEPRDGCPVVPREELDFGVIPCVACDRQGGRLGHGGGYYDRYLLGAAFPGALLCRERLLLDKAPMESHDIPVGLVITEEGVWRRGKPGR